MVSAWVLYIDALSAYRRPVSLTNWGIALIGLWVPAAAQPGRGPEHGLVPGSLTVVLKFLRCCSWAWSAGFFVKSRTSARIDPPASSLYARSGSRPGVALFSFIGVEVAAITAKQVRNPRRNVSRARLVRHRACTILSLRVSAAVIGLGRPRTLVARTAPFIPAFQAIFGGGASAGKLIAAVAVVSRASAR